jgi:hypothetical protein
VTFMKAFWDIAPCSLVEVDLRFRGAYCLHHQGDGGGARETSGCFNEGLRNYIPEECILHTRSSENLISHTVTFDQKK